MRKQKYKTMYMHTLDGEPAEFCAIDRQVVFCPDGTTVNLVRRIDTLRRQQNTCSVKLCPYQHGYVIVKVPT